MSSFRYPCLVLVVPYLSIGMDYIFIRYINGAYV